MTGIVHFKDGHTEELPLTSFTRIEGSVYFENKAHNATYCASIIPEVFELDPSKTTYKLKFFKKNYGDIDWVLTDEIEKVEIKCDEPH